MSRRRCARSFRSVSYMMTGKIGLQFKRRFWEEDDGIYSGIRAPISTSRRSSIRRTASVAEGRADRLLPEPAAGRTGGGDGRPDAGQRQRVALEQGSGSIRSTRTEFETGFSVAWQHVKYRRAAGRY